MKLYGRKFANRYIEKKLKPKTETRDAIIFEVDWNSYVCKCRIQGSNEYVNAHFPRNEATIPSWMKPGNAVRILHRTGIRGHTEVIGHGGAIPTPEPGYPSHPPTSALADMMITGGEVTADTGMFVTIHDGTYRINGVVYNLSGGAWGYVIMSETTPLMTMHENYPPAVMGDEGGVNYILMDESDPPLTISETFPPATMGIAIGSFELDAAPIQGQFRYDTFQVGEDGVIEYVKGIAATSNPLKPVISGDHVQVGKYILVVGGYTAITNGEIGLEWTAPYASGLTISAVDDFYWDGGNDYPETTITVTVLNQYGYVIGDPRTFTLTKMIGTGQVWSLQSGYDADAVIQNTSAGGYVFKYQRNQTVVETSPSFMIEVSDMTAFHNITLYNVNGDPIKKTGDVYIGYQPITSVSGAATIDWDDGIKAQITLTEDVTFTFSNGVHGDKLTLLVIQDGSGSWQVTLPSSMKYGDQITAAHLSISSEANSRTYLGFIFYAPNSSYDLVADMSGYI